MARIAAFILFGTLTIVAASAFLPAMAFFAIFSALTIFATLAAFTFTIRIVTFSHFYSPVKKITFKYTYTPYMYKCQDICYKIFHIKARKDRKYSIFLPISLDFR